jgi:hypothetical protein
VALPRSSTARRLALILGVAVLCVGVSACAADRRTKIYDVTQSEIAAGGQPYFWAGPVTYQVQISRQLNPYATEDVQYLSGIHGAQQIPPDQVWFGVFLWAKNQSGKTVVSSDRFTLHDSAGNVYYPVKLNPLLNPFAWTAKTLAPNDTQPAPDTAAANGPTQGGLILFRISSAIYANRPLTLFIYAQGQAQPSRASLDL